MQRYISSAVCVISFERDVSVRLKQAAAEKAFAKLFNKQSQQTNIPDEFDASAARLVFSDAHKQLSISQIAIQLELTFERNPRPSVADALKLFEKHSWELYKGFDKFLGKSLIRESAAIVTMNYPSNQNSGEMHAYLHNRFIKVAPYGDLASINIQIGYKTSDQFYLNFAANVYELRAKEFSPPLFVERSVTFDVSSIPVVEQGYGLKIDINSRPQKLAHSYTDMQDANSLLKKMRNAVDAESDKFLGFDTSKIETK